MSMPGHIDRVSHTLQVPSFDTKLAMLLLEAELGGPWTDFYSELTPKPIAAASLGQVCTHASSTALHATTQYHATFRQVPSTCRLCSRADHTPQH